MSVKSSILLVLSSSETRIITITITTSLMPVLYLFNSPSSDLVLKSPLPRANEVRGYLSLHHLYVSDN